MYSQSTTTNYNHFLFFCGAKLNLISYVNLGCVRLGNPDLDFENLNPDFPIERTLTFFGSGINEYELELKSPTCVSVGKYV